MTTARSPRILVAGLGNLLMGDDGAGVQACRAWLAQRPTPRHYLVAEVGTAIYGSLHLLEWADRILILDAMRAGGEPGALYRARGDELEVASASVSLHDLSLLGALRLVADRKPRRVEVLGVEPESMTLGLELSAPVARSLPRLIEEGQRIVAGWRGERIDGLTIGGAHGPRSRDLDASAA